MNYSVLKKSIYTGIIALLFSSAANSQFAKDYTPIVSSGSLPEEFLKTARAMSIEDIKTIGYGQDRAVKQQFVMSNNYFLKDLLLSGEVLINDPLTKYVNKVADELLKSNPLLRQQIHIYVTKSSDVNAYAFDKGFIFVNVGLLAQLENEAQLAYILAHEIDHVMKKHSVTEYIENVKLENGTSNYERGSYDERSLAKYRFSKEQESDADMEGLSLIKKTNYSIKALNGAFDVLQYSYLPFELVDFKKSFFEDEYLTLPDTLFLKQTSDIKANDDYDDSKSTHPNIRKRRGAIEPELKVSDEASRKKYLVSEEEFKNVRETARFELCRLYMVERDYMNAIYASYILLEKYPDNLFLKKTVSQGLYNVLVNKSSSYNRSTISIAGNSSMSSRSYSIPDYTKIEGTSQRVYYMMDNLESKELNTIALAYTFKAHKQYPDDKTLSALTDSLFSFMINSNSLFLNDFSRKSKTELKNQDTIQVVKVDSTDVEESKYSKIKKQQQKVEVETEDNFTKYAFVGLLKDDEFVSRYSKMAKGLTQKPVTDEYVKKAKPQTKKKTTDAPFFGIDKVIFIDPFYMKIKNEHGKANVQFYESEDRQQVLLDIQKKCADRLKLQYTCLTTKDIAAGDIERYNDNALLNEWLGERFKHGDNNDELVTSSENMKQLIEKLGAKYVAWSGVYNSKGGAYRNTYFFILLDLETGKLMKFETRYTRAKDSNDLISSFVYNSLMHVAKKPKQ
ncbi:MAG: hypothetical protein A3F72_18490 [Bacteroidetes bacterium RIFCSPLOWO2_12_FULL_35_15]|nr:MAG: hypothetical protein A3F72_18490 [Bacteroidetes bacterium RIFCSPLOWO2_12_FULL_35_15]